MSVEMWNAISSRCALTAVFIFWAFVVDDMSSHIFVMVMIYCKSTASRWMLCVSMSQVVRTDGNCANLQYMS